MPGARCARSRACSVVKTRALVTTVTPETPGIPRAMVLTAYIALSPVTGLSCHRRPCRSSLLKSLTPASGRQDHTTSPSAVTRPRQKRRPASIASRTNVRDDRDTPLLAGRDDAEEATDRR